MFGTGELIVILCVIMILFGGKKLPEFAKSLGKGIREFKRACNGECDEAETSTITIEPEVPPTHKNKTPEDR